MFIFVLLLVRTKYTKTKYKRNFWIYRQSTNEAGEKLALTANSRGLVQIVKGLTRASGSFCAAQLDLLFIDNVSLVSNCQWQTTITRSHKIV